MVVDGAGLRDQVSQTGRLGCGVRVERRLLHVSAAGPKAGADHLMGIRLAGDPVCSGSLGGATPREARHREVEAAPEEVHRTAFPEKRCAKLPEHVIRLHEDAPESIGILRIVRSMLLVVREANRVLHLDRYRPELDVHVHVLECGEIRPIEFRPRSVAKFYRAYLAALEN